MRLAHYRVEQDARQNTGKAPKPTKSDKIKEQQRRAKLTEEERNIEDAELKRKRNAERAATKKAKEDTRRGRLTVEEREAEDAARRSKKKLPKTTQAIPVAEVI